MKLANQSGRAVLVIGEGTEATGIVDVETASGGRLGPDLLSVYEQWDALVELAATVSTPTGALDMGQLANPVPHPRQVFGIGLNYRAHAAETGVEPPPVPATFTKFPASLTGPFDDITLEVDTVDWEVELVAVIGRRADRAPEEQGWDHIAGLAVGQDLSDRRLQRAAGAQFSLGKSRRGFGPIGPWVVTPDELDDPDDLALGCSIDGETVQDARTSDLIFSIPRLVAELSAVVPLLPGDVIFTGTPSGVGAARQPPRFLEPGQTLTSWVEGIGTITNRLR